MLAGLLALVLPAFADTLQGQDAHLGSVRFPTSGSAEARAHFLRGLAALHSFWHDEAVRSFQSAQAVDPDFAMAYWGEALAHDGVWGTGHDAERAREALSRLAPSPAARRAKAPTEREKAYLDAIEVLYGEGERWDRARRYAEAMAGLAARFPDDLEARALFARAVLATVDAWNFKDEAARAQAGAIAEDVLRVNPDHPGAAHYVIHAYDTPGRARRALPAARTYAQIAPASAHAVHMPSHIYLQLGMWEDVIESNLRAFGVSDAWVRERGLPITRRDYHPLDFLFYAYLQLGRYREARATLDSLRTPFEDTPQWSWMGRRYHTRLARYALETGRCDELPDSPPEVAAHPTVFFVLGWCALDRGQLPQAEGWLGRVRTAIGDSDEGSTQRLRTRIVERQLRALLEAELGDAVAAESAAWEAVLLGRRLGPQGELPNPIVPVHELYGEVLLRLGRPARAAGQLELALSTHPDRATTILRRARAAVAMGDPVATERYYARLLELWAGADPHLPALQEARTHLSSR